jgi:hypothetical protein
MRYDTRIIFSSVASLILAAAVYAIPPIPAATDTTQEEQPAARAQSVSGKITSVAKTSFTLNLTTDAAAQMGNQLQEENTPKTMTFAIDKNTTVDGKLSVGSNADVTYRADGGRYVAISVRVTP